MIFSQRFSFRKVAAVAAALMILPVAVACESEPEVDGTDIDTSELPADPVGTEADPTADSAEGTIVDVATGNGSFNTLVSALQAAGLVDTLNGDGPFTVFAPTDDAFAALPDGILDKLLLPENEAVLTQILQYHVVPEEILAVNAVTATVTAVDGSDLDLVAENGVVTVNEVTVSQADVAASNGVIHVIDQVLIPPSVDVSAL